MPAVSAGEDHGIEFEPMNFMSCVNNCIFCFVDQNPPGMRKALYFKDEDYRLSFLHGAYITMTALSETHIQRIEEQHLSPLYISVHVTEPSVRKKMLGIPHNDHLLEKIDRLIDSGITLHCQIVVCPGINDRQVLLQSIDDLYMRFPGIRSVAVVPVGLTKHRETLFPLQGVDRDFAVEIIDMIDKIHEEYMAGNGTGFVYCADEWYIRTGCEVPGTDYYDDFHQYENGVGMVRDFLDAVSDIEGRLNGGFTCPGKFILVTGLSMSRYIEDFSRRLSSFGEIEARAVTVSNDFFGHSVTVSGLLTGGDILRALEGTASDETVVLPPNCLNDSGVFLDDMSPKTIAEALGVKVLQGKYDPLESFFDRITG